MEKAWRRKDLLKIQSMSVHVWIIVAWVFMAASRTDSLAFVDVTARNRGMNSEVSRSISTAWIQPNVSELHFSEEQSPEMYYFSDYGVFQGQKVKMFLPVWVNHPMWSLLDYISFTENGRQKHIRTSSEGKYLHYSPEHDQRRYPVSQIVIVHKMDSVPMC